MVRVDNADFIYKTEDAKFDAAVEDIAERHEKGQPVLVGTISVEKSEKLSRELAEARHPARGAEREAARTGSRDRRPGRPALGGDRRHQHGRPRRRHPARRQPRGPGPPGVPAGRARGRHARVRGALRRAAAGLQGGVQGRGRQGARRSAASTCSAPSATSRAASTTSCAAVRAARATPARAASTSRSKTS